MFKCKEPEMKAYRNDFYEHICAWLKKQDTQQTLKEMITAIYFNEPILLCRNMRTTGVPPNAIYRN